MIDRRKIIKISPLLRNLGEWVGRPQSNEDVSSHSVSSMRHGAHWSRGRPRGVRVNDVTDVIVRSLCTAESKEKLRSFLVQIGRIYNWARRAIHRISSAVPPIMPVECSYGEKKGGGRTKARVNTENLSRASAREADPCTAANVVETFEKFLPNFNFDSFANFLAEFTLASGRSNGSSIYIYTGACKNSTKSSPPSFLPNSNRKPPSSSPTIRGACTSRPNRECQNIERRFAAGFLHDTHRGRRTQARKGEEKR